MEYFHIATNILDDFVKTYGSETGYLNTEGDIVSKEETESIVMDYL
jgi:hypothetical protein